MGQTPPRLNNCVTPPDTPSCSPKASAPQPLLKHTQHMGQAPIPGKDSYSLQKALVSETLNSQVNSEGWQIEQAKAAEHHAPRRGRVFCILREGTEGSLFLRLAAHFSHRFAQAGEEIPGQFWSLLPSPTSKSIRYPTRTELAEPALPLCPAAPLEPAAAGLGPAPALPHRPAPASPTQCNASICVQQQHRILQRRNH